MVTKLPSNSDKLVLQLVCRNMAEFEDVEYCFAYFGDGSPLVSCGTCSRKGSRRISSASLLRLYAGGGRCGCRLVPRDGKSVALLTPPN